MSDHFFAICIPTYNRAEILRQTLAHLAEHHDLFDELVICDNASPDHTGDVVHAMTPLFRRLTYVRHDENIGSFRNSRAALSISRCRYQYLLSDDDRLVPEGIRAGLSCLAGDPEAVAVYGSYQHLDERGEFAFQVKYAEAPIRFTAADRLAVIQKYMGMWNPIMRSEAFQRHCYCDRESFTHWQIITQLLTVGAVWLIPDDFYQHYATENRLENGLIKPWFHEYGRADLELSLGRLLLTPGAPEIVAAFMAERAAYVQQVAVQMAKSLKDPVAEHHYMIRQRAYGTRWLEGEAKWEEESLIAITLYYVTEQLRGTGRRRVVVEDGLLNLGALLPRLRASLPGIGFELMAESEFQALPDAPDLVLLAERWSSFGQSVAGETGQTLRIAWYDVMLLLRLTDPVGPRALLGPDGSAHLVEFFAGEL